MTDPSAFVAFVHDDLSWSEPEQLTDPGLHPWDELERLGVSATGRAQLRRAVTALLAGNPVRRLTADGVDGHAWEVTATLLPHAGRGPSVLLSAREISAGLERERTLHRALDHQQLMCNSLGVKHLAVDASGRITRAERVTFLDGTPPTGATLTHLAPDQTWPPNTDEPTPLHAPGGSDLGIWLWVRDPYTPGGFLGWGINPASSPPLTTSIPHWLELLPCMAWSSGPQGEPRYFNARNREFLGAHHSTSSVQLARAMIHPFDRSKALVRWGRAIEDRAPFRCELRLRDAHGNYHWALSMAQPHLDETGEIVEWIGVNLLLDPDEPSQQLIRLREAQLRMALEAMGEGILLLAPHGELVEANSMAMRLLGFQDATEAHLYLRRPERYVQRFQLTDLHGHPLHPRAWPLARAVGGETFDRHEVQFLDPRLGLRRACAISSQRLRSEDSQQYLIAVRIRDVSQELQARHDLERHQEQLRQSQRVGQLGSWEWDLSNDTLSCSDGLLDLLGLPPDVDRSRLDVLRPLIHPDDYARAEDELSRALVNRSDWSCELRLTRPDGQERVLSCRAQFLSGGPNLRLVGSVVDVTSRKRDERERALMVRELDHRVMNNLSVVLSIMELTLHDARDLDDFAERFRGRVRALARVHHLLAEAGWSGLTFTALARDLLGAFLPDSDRRCRLHGPEHLNLPVRLVGPLGVALYELASNAAKHGSLSTPGGHIDLSWERNGEALCVEWRESGGPPVHPPQRQGYGYQVLTEGFAFQTGGRTQLRFDPRGLRCSLEVSLRRSSRLSS